MTRILQGRAHGKTIEFDEDLGIEEGQVVEVQVTIPDSTTSESPQLSDGLTRLYEILGERYDSGRSDIAARHNEHQP
jgi:hypothetical protein